MTAAPALLPDLRTTLVVAVEVSKTAWVIAAHVPGLWPSPAYTDTVTRLMQPLGTPPSSAPG
jgi:hypothetical protein